MSHVIPDGRSGDVHGCPGLPGSDGLDVEIDFEDGCYWLPLCDADVQRILAVGFFQAFCRQRDNIPLTRWRASPRRSVFGLYLNSKAAAYIVCVGARKSVDNLSDSAPDAWCVSVYGAGTRLLPRTSLGSLPEALKLAYTTIRNLTVRRQVEDED